MCTVIHNQINLGNNVLYNLLDYENKFIERLTSKEMIARDSLSVSDASIIKQIIRRHDFDISEDEKM